jgi:ATP/maltotriose-dependent transcriptional regulator MalT
VLEIFRGDAARALGLAEEAAKLCDEHGFAYWHAMASAVRGQAWILRGESRAGVDELTRALGALRATGTRVFSTHILAFLADAHRRAGRLAEGLAAANEGVDVAESTLDRTYRPELWRLKGELLRMMAEPGPRGRRSTPAGAESPGREAERCLLRAYELARESEARSSELRAAISLARLWKASGRQADARAVLAPVYEWFGRDAQGESLDDARVLLDELRRSSRRRT